jgi:hypothetical protein
VRRHESIGVCHAGRVDVSPLVVAVGVGQVLGWSTGNDSSGGASISISPDWSKSAGATSMSMSEGDGVWGVEGSGDDE